MKFVFISKETKGFTPLAEYWGALQFDQETKSIYALVYDDEGRWRRTHSRHFKPAELQ